MENSAAQNETVSFLTVSVTKCILVTDLQASNQVKRIANAPKHVLLERIFGLRPSTWLRHDLHVENGTVPFWTKFGIFQYVRNAFKDMGDEKYG